MAKKPVIEEDVEVEVVEDEESTPLPLPMARRTTPAFSSEMTFYARSSNMQKACHKYGPDGKLQFTVIVEFGPDSAMTGPGVYGRAVVSDRDVQKAFLAEIKQAEELGRTCDLLTADQYSLEIRARHLTEKNAVQDLLVERDKLAAELNRLKGGGSQGNRTLGSLK